jgi:hypothetical protein
MQGTPYPKAQCFLDKGFFYLLEKLSGLFKPDIKTGVVMFIEGRRGPR